MSAHMWYFLIERHLNSWRFMIPLSSQKKFDNDRIKKAVFWLFTVMLISCERISCDTLNQKAKIAANIVHQMSFFLLWNAHIMIQIQCDGFDVACWVCNMSLSSNSYNNYLLFGFLGPVCHAIGGHLGLFRHCLFSHGRPINFSRPCPLQGRSLPTARASYCLDPFTSVVNE